MSHFTEKYKIWQAHVKSGDGKQSLLAPGAKPNRKSAIFNLVANVGAIF